MAKPKVRNQKKSLKKSERTSSKRAVIKKATRPGRRSPDKRVSSNGAKDKGSSHSPELLLKLYREILKPRMIEEKMLLLLRQGKVSKWFSGIGQEAIAVGVTMALQPDEFILPLHRNLGVFTGRGMPFARLLSQWQGKDAGFSHGRERSFHFGSLDYHIVGMISHLGPQLCVADGIALASKLNREGKVTVAFTGEGGTSEGDFHEALNVAAVWDLPVIFVIENNGYALSTPPTEQYRCESLVDRAAGYGMEGIKIDGNDLLTVYDTISRIAKELRDRPRPVLVECMTFRMRGHEEASGTKYVPKELMESWAKRDPLKLYEQRLISDGVLTAKIKAEISEAIATELESGIEQVFAEPEIEPDNERELSAVYPPVRQLPQRSAGSISKNMRFVDAIQDGLREALNEHPDLVLMGQDIADYGGVFKVTDGLMAKFGRERVRNTPLCESAILGAALGLGIKGMKSVVEMQFADFVSCGFNQIVNNLAKIHYRWGALADSVVRMPTGAGSGAGPFHSQSNEAWFFHVPGLKIVYPSNPHEAKGLLLSAIEDPAPVMFFEHKGLYRSVQGEVPEGYYTESIGTPRVVREGQAVTIITYGMGVHWANELLKRYPEIDALLLDLRTLLPIDWETLYSAARHTGRVMVLHEDTLTGGIGGEISARITEHCFESLDAPVIRVGALDTPVPFAPVLEQAFLPKREFEQKLLSLLAY